MGPIGHSAAACLGRSAAKDLQRDPIVMWQHRHYGLLTLIMNLALPVLLGVWHGDIIGTVLLVGLLRLVINHHVTFFINSLAHFWGSRPYTEANSARDNGFLAFLTYGEGYHNFHHIFQTDYRNGIRWWQFDPTKWLIKGCELINLTSKLRVSPEDKIEKEVSELKESSQQIELQWKNERDILSEIHTKKE